MDRKPAAGASSSTRRINQSSGSAKRVKSHLADRETRPCGPIWHRPKMGTGPSPASSLCHRSPAGAECPWENRLVGDSIRLAGIGEVGLPGSRPGASRVPPAELYSFRRRRIDYPHDIRSSRSRQRQYRSSSVLRGDVPGRFTFAGRSPDGAGSYRGPRRGREREDRRAEPAPTRGPRRGREREDRRTEPAPTRGPRRGRKSFVGGGSVPRPHSPGPRAQPSANEKG